MDRKVFLKNSVLLGSTFAFTPNTLLAQSANESFTIEEIKEFVGAAHRDFDKTNEILNKKPLILNCTNQPVPGDFETAMGGASHVGRKDIADLLMAKGARLDIFNLTFLGYTDVVKELIKAFPHYLNAYGPHGFTLLHHANVGKHTDFARWLEDQGLTTNKFTDIFVSK